MTNLKEQKAALRTQHNAVVTRAEAESDMLRTALAETLQENRNIQKDLERKLSGSQASNRLLDRLLKRSNYFATRRLGVKQ
jgi:chlorite dismutase